MTRRWVDCVDLTWFVVVCIVCMHTRVWLGDWPFAGLHESPHQVMLQDVSARCSMFTLMGAEAASVLESLGITQLANQPLHSHALLNFKGSPVMVAGMHTVPLAPCCCVCMYHWLLVVPYVYPCVYEVMFLVTALHSAQSGAGFPCLGTR